MIGAGNDSQFAVFAAALGRPDWASNDLYHTNAKRVENRIALIAHITEALAEKNTSEWLESFKGKGFAFAPISRPLSRFTGNDDLNTIQTIYSRPSNILKPYIEAYPPKSTILEQDRYATPFRHIFAWLLSCPVLQIDILTNPVVYNGSKLPLTRPPPVLAQHTAEILAEESYTESDISELKESGAI